MKKSSALTQIAFTLFAATFGVGLAAATFGEAKADTYVHGYTRNNGTYVAPHYRSSPDSSYNNNWSVSPNINPYTGQQGTRAPTYDSNPFSSQNNPFSSQNNPFSSHNLLDLD